MVAGTGEESSRPSRRLVITWSVAFGLLLLAFIATVIALNATLFSASGFAQSYLNALARRDLDAALAMPGVAPDPEASTALLQRQALASIDEVTLVSDVDEGGGLHSVTLSYTLEGGTAQTTTFHVEHTGALLGVFSAWRFSESPIGVLAVTPHNTVEFEVNGIEAVAERGVDQANPFAVMIPGAYTISHDSSFLTAKPKTIVLPNAGATEDFSLEVQASKAFVDAVQEQLASYLEGCATQEVLLPTGCPFGKSISNRIVGLPSWSIMSYPTITIVPGDTSGTWFVPEAAGSAHLTVDVKSLFDGTVSTLDENVSFTVSYLVTLPGDGSLTLTPL